MKKVAKHIFLSSILFIVAIFLIAIIIISGLYIFSNKTQFDINKIKNSSISFEIYDNQNRRIKDECLLGSFIKLNTLHSYTKDAFISIEDKNFYKHNGLNYKRMVKAMLKNISSFSLKEGASTISQQLIKNTHLTNKKTFSRKINEIALTKKLEHTLSKDEILEYYLNIIYFGDNCYGIENASRHYFSKNAKDLSIEESATLAGLIKSPNTYSPTKNIQKTRSRRNVVLGEMFKDNKITFNEYNTAISLPINVKISVNNENTLNTYTQATIDEATQILKMPAKQIAIGEYKIYSNMDKNKQDKLQKSLSYYDNGSDYAGISINNSKKVIEAYYAKSNVKLLNAKRQPGSCIKPILVYTPALNENLISPLTQINDEPININGYSPNNIGGKFVGYTSIRNCVSKSLNIPAVKVLSYVGINKAKSYATKCGIVFDENDQSLSLALGGLTYGVSLKDLTNSYTTLANYGKFTQAKFINYITDNNGKIIYHYSPQEKIVFRDDSAYLMTDILKTCAKSGTGRKLGNLDFEVATKTGTVGKKENTDAYNISYTSQDTVGIWLGNADNSPIETVGGAIPTDITKMYLAEIYKNSKPKDFDIPNSIYEEKIDTLALNSEHVVYKASSFIPEKYQIIERFSKFNQPKEKIIDKICIKTPTLNGKVENKTAYLSFYAYDYLIYEIYKEENGNDFLLSTITNTAGLCEQKFDLNKRTKFFVVTKLKNYADNTEIISDKSNIIELLAN